MQKKDFGELPPIFAVKECKMKVTLRDNREVQPSEHTMEELSTPYPDHTRDHSKEDRRDTLQQLGVAKVVELEEEEVQLEGKKEPKMLIELIDSLTQHLSRKSTFVWAHEKLPSPEEKGIRTLVVTWNMAGRKPLANIEPLFKSDSVKHHLVVVSCQESCNSILKSFLWNSKSAMRKSIMNTLTSDYIEISFESSNAMFLGVYAHRSISEKIKDRKDFKINCGTCGLNNKGAIATGMTIFGREFCFVGAHLTSGGTKVQRRNQNVQKIRNKLYESYCMINKKRRLGSASGTDLSILGNSMINNTQHDCLEGLVDHVIWAGDFNYRVNMSRIDSELHSYKSHYRELLNLDQLLIEKKKGNTFQDYVEADINFPPSYKYNKYQNTFTSKKRTPSYTDRILHAGKNKHNVKIRSYDSESEVVWSDHKPVFAQLEISLTQ